MAAKARPAEEKIRLSSEGTWYQGGVEITHERTKELFFRSVALRDGRFILTGDKVPVPVEVEDTAYFVRSLSKKKDGSGFDLNLSDGTSEPLDPSTLDVGPAEALYCRVKDGKAHAKFERKVYYELTKGLVERDGFYGLLLNGLFYPLKRVEPPAVEAKPVPVARKSAPPKKNPSAGKVKKLPPPKKRAAPKKAAKSAAKKKSPAPKEPAKARRSAKSKTAAKQKKKR